MFYVKDQEDNSKSIVCSVTEKTYKLNGETCEDMDVFSPLSNKLVICGWMRWMVKAFMAEKIVMLFA